MAILVETSTLWGRKVVAGIQNHARRHGPWLTFIEPRGLEEPVSLPPGWQGDGIIARVSQPRMAEELLRAKTPVVNVSGIVVEGFRFPRVTTNLEAAGTMAARYFLDRGYRHCAYFSLTGLQYVTEHREAFSRILSEDGAECREYAVRPRHGAEPDWNLDLARIGDWLKELPRPVGILTWNPSSAREVLYACRVAGLQVPEDVAILSGSDDDLFCEFSHVPLSGIQASAEQIGHQAAVLLDRLMKGGQPPSRPIRIPPLGIVTRQSTDTLAVSDPALVKAVSFIRENAGRPIRVADVARCAGVSRRLLEQRFGDMLHRTPADEIRRVHIERAKDLLIRTDMPIPEVAEAAGFGSPEYLSYVFHRETGKPPLRYRREARCR